MTKQNFDSMGYKIMKDFPIPLAPTSTRLLDHTGGGTWVYHRIHEALKSIKREPIYLFKKE